MNRSKVVYCVQTKKPIPYYGRDCTFLVKYKTYLRSRYCQ